MSSIAAVILHAPRELRERREIMAMPMGLLSIAAHLADRGVPAEILHLGIERELEPAFDPAAAITAAGARVALVALHWHAQVRPALLLCESLRRRLPELFIAVGGYTASYFARELLAGFPAVDAVVRGDGEEPAAALCAAVAAGADPARLAAVPNLAWRRGNGVTLNPLTWRVDEANAAALRHGAFGHLRHAAEYLARDLYADFNEGAAAGLTRTFFYNPGRGCSAACTCCGGGRDAQRALAGREGFLCYPPAKVHRDLEDAWGAGARTWRVSFDPTVDRAGLAAALAAERAAGRGWRLVFDCWSLPSPLLVEAVAGECAPGSVLIVSPECGDEGLRRAHRGYSFTNAELLDAVARVRAAGLGAHAFLTAGLPGETRPMLAATARLAEALARAGAGVSVCPMLLDPGSPLFEHPERYGVRLRVRSLRDYYRLHPTDPGPGYRTEHLSETDIRVAVQQLRRAAEAAAASAPR